MLRYVSFLNLFDHRDNDETLSIFFLLLLLFFFFALYSRKLKWSVETPTKIIPRTVSPRLRFFFGYAGRTGRRERRKEKERIERTGFDSRKRLSIANTMIIGIIEFDESLRFDGFRFREHVTPRYFRRSLHLVTLFPIRREQRTGGVWITLAAGRQHKWIHVERWTDHLS